MHFFLGAIVTLSVAISSLAIPFYKNELSLRAPGDLRTTGKLDKRTPDSGVLQFGEGKTTVGLADLAIGDVVYAQVIINIDDIAVIGSKSHTTRKIKSGAPVRRICIVLAKEPTSVTVTYLSTFNSATKLPERLDKQYWYPVTPAQQEGTLEPLPKFSGTAEWVSLRKKQIISTNTFDKLGTVNNQVVPKILAHMHE